MEYTRADNLACRSLACKCCVSSQPRNCDRSIYHLQNFDSPVCKVESVLGSIFLCPFIFRTTQCMISIPGCRILSCGWCKRRGSRERWEQLRRRFIECGRNQQIAPWKPEEKAKWLTTTLANHLQKVQFLWRHHHYKTYPAASQFDPLFEWICINSRSAQSILEKKSIILKKSVTYRRNRFWGSQAVEIKWCNRKQMQCPPPEEICDWWPYNCRITL